MDFSAWKPKKTKQKHTFPIIDKGSSETSLVLKKLKAAMESLSTPKNDFSLLESTAREIATNLYKVLEDLCSNTVTASS